jgi:hypothetical protein
MCTSHGQSRSRHVADAMLAKLPRELRDCVYGYLWGQDLGVAKDLLLRRAMVPSSDGNPQDIVKLVCLGDPVYLGEIVVGEVLSYLYRSCFMPYKGPLALRSVGHFLKSDPYQRNLTPLLFINTLNMRWTDSALSPRAQQAIAAALNTLEHVQFPKPIPVHLVLNGYLPFDNKRKHKGKDLVHKLERFRKAFEALIERGHAVRVTEENHNLDLADFYRMSADEWVKRMNDRGCRGVLIEAKRGVGMNAVERARHLNLKSGRMKATPGGR